MGIQPTLLTTTGDIMYASSASNPARLGIGTANQVLRVNSGATAPEWATPSSAGITWTQRQTSINSSMYKIEYNGTNLYVAVGNNGNLYSSPDGLTWTARTSGFGSNAILDVFYGNGLWVIVGTSGVFRNFIRRNNLDTKNFKYEHKW